MHNSCQIYALVGVKTHENGDPATGLSFNFYTTQSLSALPNICNETSSDFFISVCPLRAFSNSMLGTYSEDWKSNSHLYLSGSISFCF